MKYPSGFELAVHMTKEEKEHHIRLMAALKMFELGKVSSGKAAEFAGMSRVEFLETCGRYHVSVQLSCRRDRARIKTGFGSCKKNE